MNHDAMRAQDEVGPNYMPVKRKEEKRTMSPAASRTEVYAAIDGERDYQDAGRGNARRHENRPAMTPGEIILCMQHCLVAARTAWYAPDGGTACLEHIRKVTALGVQAMELYGAPPRS